MTMNVTMVFALNRIAALIRIFSGNANLVPRALFPGFEGGAPTSKAWEKRPGDEVVEMLYAEV